MNISHYPQNNVTMTSQGAHHLVVALLLDKNAETSHVPMTGGSQQEAVSAKEICGMEGKQIYDWKKKTALNRFPFPPILRHFYTQELDIIYYIVWNINKNWHEKETRIQFLLLKRQNPPLLRRCVFWV